MGEIMQTIAVSALPLLLAITLHEAAHGYVANMLGDHTAKRLGRVSLNPVRHIDPFGTVLLPLFLFLAQSPFLFGYAKPVPVNANYLNNPRYGMVLVALAGPGINIALACIAGLLIHLTGILPGAAQEWWLLMLQFGIYINLLLALFNLLPIPPLDGGRVAVGLLPRPLARPLARLEQYGMFILLGLLILLPLLGGLLGRDWNIFRWVILPPLDFLYSLILQFIVGIPA